MKAVFFIILAIWLIVFFYFVIVVKRKKPCREWLSLIADNELRQMALDNFDKYGYRRDWRCWNVNEAIDVGFFWHKTPQGQAFWRLVSDSKIKLRKI
jgi:hypothetical protein